jgi:hypothetical protein
MHFLVLIKACLVSLFHGVSATKREKRGKARQTSCFFCAAVKGCFGRSLDFELKHEKSHNTARIGILPTAASKRRASTNHENKHALKHAMKASIAKMAAYILIMIDNVV